MKGAPLAILRKWLKLFVCIETEPRWMVGTSSVRNITSMPGLCRNRKKSNNLSWVRMPNIIATMWRLAISNSLRIWVRETMSFTCFSAILRIDSECGKEKKVGDREVRRNFAGLTQVGAETYLSVYLLNCGWQFTWCESRRNFFFFF